MGRQTLVDGSITPQGGSPCHAVCWASVPEEKTSLHLFPLTASTAGVLIYKASEQRCADFNHFSTDTDHYQLFECHRHFSSGQQDRPISDLVSNSLNVPLLIS